MKLLNDAAKYFLIGATVLLVGTGLANYIDHLHLEAAKSRIKELDKKNERELVNRTFKPGKANKSLRAPADLFKQEHNGIIAIAPMHETIVNETLFHVSEKEYSRLSKSAMLSKEGVFMSLAKYAANHPLKDKQRGCKQPAVAFSRRGEDNPTFVDIAIFHDHLCPSLEIGVAKGMGDSKGRAPVLHAIPVLAVIRNDDGRRHSVGITLILARISDPDNNMISIISYRNGTSSEVSEPHSL